MAYRTIFTFTIWRSANTHSPQILGAFWTLLIKINQISFRLSASLKDAGPPTHPNTQRHRKQPLRVALRWFAWQYSGRLQMSGLLSKVLKPDTLFTIFRIPKDLTWMFPLIKSFPLKLSNWKLNRSLSKPVVPQTRIFCVLGDHEPVCAPELENVS